MKPIGRITGRLSLPGLVITRGHHLTPIARSGAKNIFAGLPLPELQSRITEMRAAEGDSFRFSKSLEDRVAEIRRPRC